jgi:archaellum component FlaG (FlaF/FlaG flagellin family)
MGFSESASQIIMFIAVVTIAGALVFIFNQQITESAGAVSARQDYLNNQLRTAVAIESAKYDAGQITAYVKNVGESSVYPNRTMVYIDKERIIFDENLSFSVEADTERKNTGIFDPEEVMKITINKTLVADETHELLIVSQYNARDAYEFSS